MATKTDSPDPKLDPGQADYDKKFNDIRKAEEDGDFNDIVKNYDNPGDSTAEGARQAEESSDAGFTNNYTGANSGTVRGKVQKGPLGVIIGAILALGGVVGVGYGTLVIEPIWIIQSVFNNGTLNPRSTVASRLTDKILYDKFEAQVTDGICGPKISILCKYSRPSNYQLKKMEDLGYKAVDTAGNSVRTLGLFPNKRPDFVVYTDKNAVVQKIPANKIRAQMKLDPDFNKAMLSIYNPRWATAADSVVTKLKKLFGYDGRDKYKNVPADQIDETRNKVSAGEDLGAKGATTESAQQTLIRKLFGDEIEKSLAKLGQSGKGDAVGLVGGAVCVATDVPGVAVKVSRAYQMGQIIRYGALFMAAAGALQAGDGSGTESTALGKQLNDQDSNGKAATDSFGIRSDLSNTPVVPSNTSYQKFIPGFTIAAAVGGAAAILSSKEKDQACAAISNPVTGVAINAALAPETLGIGTLINVGVGVAAAAALTSLAGPLADLIVSSIPPSVYESVLSAFLGDVTTNLSGEASGDALASAFENIAGQTCSLSGCTPLTVTGAVAFTKDAQASDLAYAQLDRATHSPLDASNPNTALGSFLGQFMPYYSQLGTGVTGFMSMVGSLTSNSMSSLVNTKLSAADPSLRFTQCPLQGTVIPKENAALNFCSLYYGIDPQYLDSGDPNVSDPLTIATNLANTGQIDMYTGESTDPGNAITAATNTIFGAPPDDASTYQSWEALCTDGTLDHISECTSSSPKEAAFSIYKSSTSVRAGMDGEDPALTGSSTDTTTAAYNSQAQTYLSMLSDFNTPQPAFIPSGQISPETGASVAALQPATMAQRFALPTSPISLSFGVMA